MDIFTLLEIPDLLRASSVCSSWNVAYTSLRSSGLYRQPQTPFLLYTTESDADNVACLYNLAEDRVYRLTLPEPAIRSWYLIGSSNGWLVTADERSELHMVNPITGERIALPPVTTIEQVKPILDDAGVIQEYELSHFSGEEVFRDPTIDALHELPTAAYEDCIYVDGVLYAVTAASGIDAFDLTGPTNLRKVIMEGTKNYIYEHIYITQTPSGELLVVWREQDAIVESDDVPADIRKETRRITLYKVDMEAKELVEVDSLHDHALFLGYSQSYCVSAEEYPPLKANHVYLTDNERFIAFWKNINCRDICVFNLESNTIEEVVPPQCWCSWPAPIWITPNLTKISS
ncbi:hypothetical protein PVAP13_8NG134500 [Panicum virgatum]|uniref:KIB1-4 beta-propeller domain-containing protein n=1 Tax=Panicum virgatum TaxID=38727 RepID=A0A8T0P9M9_PANVG|nr:hypothetical protein PVAP13_8NG134500 [Panicum virgatum]